MSVSVPIGPTGRLARLREAMAARQVPALLVTDNSNLRWVTGFTGSHGFALVMADEAWVAVDSRYTLQAEQQCPHLSLHHLTSSAAENLADLIKATVQGVLAFESDTMTVAALDDYQSKLDGAVSLVPERGAIRDLRMVKDDTEIAAIKQACHIADDVFDYACGVIEPGMSERDVMLEIEWRIRRHHGAEVSFPSIAVSGPRSAMPHGRPSERILTEGDLVTLDFGARCDGYCSDITRTVVLGEPSTEQREVYGIVLDAQQRAIAAAMPGVAAKDVDAVAREHIGSCGHAEHFGHGLGHSVGLDVHDGAGMSPTSKTVLAAGMVLTFEPGVYIPEWGGVRIEDDVLITDDGPRVLTHCDRGLIAL